MSKPSPDTFTGVIHDGAAEIERLRGCVRFFAKVIKTGGRWGDRCEAEYREAMGDAHVTEQKAHAVASAPFFTTNLGQQTGL